MAGVSLTAAGELNNTFKFNGIEENGDFDLNTYEAYYRTNAPQIGRWWQVDPKTDSLLGLSPYNSMANNPINLTDPNGDLIQFDQNSTSDFKKKTLLALVTLIVKGAGGNIKQLAASDKVYVFQEEKGQISSFHFGKDGCGGVVGWNPNLALMTTNNIAISATTILNHELDHAVKYDDLKYSDYLSYLKSPFYEDRQYDNVEEKRAIMFNEQQTALAMGEIHPGQVTRADHSGKYFIRTSSPNSVTGRKEYFELTLTEVVVKTTKKDKKNKSKN